VLEPVGLGVLDALELVPPGGVVEVPPLGGHDVSGATYRNSVSVIFWSGE
jgi:hypothetical protein